MAKKWYFYFQGRMFDGRYELAHSQCSPGRLTYIDGSTSFNAQSSAAVVAHLPR